MSTVLVVALVVASAGFVSGLTAFGFALVSVPLLALLIGAHDAVVLSLLLGTVTSILMSTRQRAHVDRPIARRMVVGALLGMPLGLLVLVALPDHVLRLVVALCVVAAVLALRRGLNLHHVGPGLDLGAGFVSGVLNTAVSTNGPPLALTLQARQLPPNPFRGTLALVLAVSNVVGVVLVVVAGQVDAELLRLCAWSVLPMLGGWWSGLRLSQHLDAARFRSVVLGLLLASAGVTALSVLL